MRKAVQVIFRVFASSFLVVFLLVSIFASYIVGFRQGSLYGEGEASGIYEEYLSQIRDTLSQVKEPVRIEVPSSSAPTKSGGDLGLVKNVSWGGPDLWSAVNKRRIEFGVNELSQKDDLCTVASIRLNELLELGKLDGHEGFSSLADRRPDIDQIFQRYSAVAEFLAAGGESATETVGMWENTLAHSKLLKGGEYVWGCIYAQNSFAVAITAY